MTDVVGIAHVVVRVSDWRASSRWYQDVLGFERHRGDGFSVFRHQSAPFAILLAPTDAELAPSASPSQRVDHLALHVPTLDALETWRNALASRGVAVDIEHQPSIGSSITLHDPDGLEIELFVPAPDTVLDVG